MAITLKVNTVDKSDQIDWTSLSKNEQIGNSPDTLTFLVKNHANKTYRPAINDEVQLLNGSDLIFGGLVVEVSESVNGLVKYVTVVCKDYTHTLDRMLVSQTFTNQTVNAIITSLASTYLSGFTTTNVNCTTVINSIVFNYLTVSQCLEKIVKMIGNFDWFVEYNKDIHFFQSDIVPAPFSITDTSANFNWNSLSINSTSDQIRNTITIRGGEIQSPNSKTEIYDGDGAKDTFVLGNKFGSKPTVTVGGVSKTVGLDFVDNDADFAVMWNFNQKYLRFTSGNIPPAGTNNVVATGYPLYPLIAIFDNAASVTAYGIYEFLVIDKTIKTQAAAEQRALAEILQYGQPTAKGKFTTYTPGLSVGQTISINSTLRGINASYKITEIAGRIHNNTDGILIYEVGFVSADIVGINDILARLLILNPSDQIDVSADEVVQRIKGFNETAVMSDSATSLSKRMAPYYLGTGTANDIIVGYSTWG